MFGFVRDIPAKNKKSKYIVDLDNVTVRFNKASENVDNLKEYFVKMIHHELMFQEFLALQDITLKIKPGEAWGFVGTNGAGKSTLLKVISKILKPYKGTVSVNGTIASLIELGAGIDPQLTARENIFLNGTILGYSKKFIESKFDDIVSFSELDEFLDSPVKNFSSGMKTRLSFSIATVMEPEILIVDEILAVGDALFRKKCMDRMNHMLSGGTTLLLVSHNISDIQRLCTKAMWINRGKTVMTGEVSEVCTAYQENIAALKEKERIEREKKKQLDAGKKFATTYIVDSEKYPELIYRAANYNNLIPMVYDPEEKAHILKRLNCVDFVSYFNCLQVGMLKKKTYAKSFKLHLIIKGKGSIELLEVFKNSKTVNYAVMSSQVISADEKTEIVLDIPDTNKPLVSFEATALEDLYIYKGWYSAEVESDKIREIKISLAINMLKIILRC